MDAGLLKAGIVMAVGLTLLVPTFNALNASYVQNVRPPPWMPTPPTPPDMTPPTDMTPPPDFTPPTNYKGPIPPGMQCPPPVLRRLNESEGTYPFPSNSPQQTFSGTRPFTVPNTTIAVVGYINVTNWKARDVTVTLQPPQNGKTWSNQSNGDLLFNGVDLTGFYNSTKEGYATTPPPSGMWKATWTVNSPISGEVTTAFAAVLACGGLGAK